MSSTQIDTMLWHTQTRRAGDTGRQGRKPGKETTMTTKEMIRSEYAKVWARDQKMVDYCAGKVAAVAILNDGLVYPVDKQKIETRFCFGESGYDYLQVFVNGVEKVGKGANRSPVSSFEQLTWFEFSQSLNAGDTITISFRKDSSGNSGLDAGFFRNFSFVQVA